MGLGRRLLGWTGIVPGLEGAGHAPDTSQQLCQIQHRSFTPGRQPAPDAQPAARDQQTTTQPAGGQRAGGRSQPGGRVDGAVQAGGAVKSHQVPSNGNNPASASAITRFPSARTAASSATQ